MPSKDGKKSEGSPTYKALRFAIKVASSSVPLAISDFEGDERSWGPRKSFRAMIDQVNDAWSMLRGGPLFEYLGADQELNPKKRAYIRRVDNDQFMMPPQIVAVLPALMAYLNPLRKTPFETAFQAFFNFAERKLDKGSRKHVVKSMSKYHLVTKGVKDYSQHEDVLEEVQKALVYENILKVTRRIDKPGKTKTTEDLSLQPLTLLMYNGGLYLLAHRHPRQEKRKPVSYRLESFTAAKATKEKFPYPADFKPAEHFRGAFGLFNNGDALTEVVLEIVDPAIETYVTDRQWTEKQTYDKATRTLKMSVRDTTEITGWVLGFAGMLRVKSPADVRQKVEEAASRLTQVHKAS